MKLTTKQLKLLNLTESEAARIPHKTLKKLIEQAELRTGDQNYQEPIQKIKDGEYDDLGNPITNPKDGKSGSFDTANKIKKAPARTGDNTKQEGDWDSDVDSMEKLGEEEEVDDKETTSEEEEEDKKVNEEEEEKEDESTSEEDDKEIKEEEEDDKKEDKETTSEEDEEVNEEEDNEKDKESTSEEDEEEKEKEDKEVEEDVKAMFQGEKLSEEFQTKAKTIFESAIKRTADRRMVKLKESLIKKYDKVLKKSRNKLAEQVDSYLDYVVNEWMEDNKLAVEQGLRTEITEEFIHGLKNLFESSLIDVPAAKTDLVDTLTVSLQESKTSLNEAQKKIIALRKEVCEERKERLLQEGSAGLTDTEAAKLRELTETVEYRNQKDFAKKLLQLRESYFPDTKLPEDWKMITEVEEIEDTPSNNTSGSKEMDKYIEAAKNYRIPGVA